MTLHRSHYRWPGSSDQGSDVSDQNRVPITDFSSRDTGPANSSASRRNQKTFASHVRDGLRSSHPSPMHHSPAPDLVDRSEKRGNTIRLDRTPAPCGTEPDDRTHSLFTMSNNWLAEQAKAPAEPRSAANSYGRTIRKTRRDRGSMIGTAPAPSLASGEPARIGRAGGARRDRTDDLMLAKHALSQLSYGPGRRTDDRPRRTGGTSSVLRGPSSDPGGPGKTRTSDLTLIKRAL
jgi:hypothetical protein